MLRGCRFEITTILDTFKKFIILRSLKVWLSFVLSTNKLLTIYSSFSIILTNVTSINPSRFIHRFKHTFLSIRSHRMYGQRTNLKIDTRTIYDFIPVKLRATNPRYARRRGHLLSCLIGFNSATPSFPSPLHFKYYEANANHDVVIIEFCARRSKHRIKLLFFFSFFSPSRVRESGHGN